MTKLLKKERLKALEQAVTDDPFLTDESLSEMFKVSIQTIRLDRMSLGIPESRERVKTVATENIDKVKTLSRGEIVGELIDLPDDHVIAMFVVVGKATKPAWSRPSQLTMSDILIRDHF